MSHITEEQIEWIYTRYDGDMINCANAVARQAVVSYIDQQARELPVLPDPRIAEEEWFQRLRAGTDFYTVDQLKAYGAACAAHAREMALFTRPMPPQIIGLQDVHDAVTADPTLADCAQDVTELVEALEKLARLGNGEHYGNSDGNMIARMALSRYKGAK